MNILVLGGGISGVSAANLAFEKGYSVTLSESKKETPFLNQLNPNIHLVTGPQTESLLDDIHLIIVSPGIPYTIPIIKEAVLRSIEMKSEVEFALRYFEGSVIGITGTNGKSTTTSMTAHILRGLGNKAVECGNIGQTVSNVILENQNPDTLVIELSSYQLHSSLKLVVDTGAFLNFTTDHLAYHGTLKEYFKAKSKIFEFSRGTVYGYRSINSDFDNFDAKIPPNLHVLSEQSVYEHREQLKHLASHDQMNGLFAGSLATEIVKRDLSAALNCLSTFKSLPHRFQRHVAPNSNVFINDSKATNVDSTLTALNSVEKDCVLLLGGQAKGESFAPLLKFKDKIKHVYFFGEAASQLERELTGLAKYDKATTLAELFHRYGDSLKEASTLLFSPACASFDEFQNYEERGHYFESFMNKLYN